MTCTHLAVDPGNVESGWVLFRLSMDEVPSPPLDVVEFGTTPNEKLRQQFDALQLTYGGELGTLCIEMMKARGMPSANEEFETLVNVGRFIECWPGAGWTYVFRMDVKAAVCGAAHAKDSNVRAALIDLWGGEEQAFGGKRCEACKGTGQRSVRASACATCGGAVCPTCKNRRVAGLGRKRGPCPACKGVPCPTCHDKPPTGWVQVPCTCQNGYAVPKGPLYGMSGDQWPALGIAYAWSLNPQTRQYLSPSNKPKLKLAEVADGRTDAGGG